MFLKDFYNDVNGKVLIESEQASHFAKDIAGDFNPIHDHDSKRFCVPGDLLFSIVLEKYGLSQNMSFTFSGMVKKDVMLDFPDSDSSQFDITDDKGKSYLSVQRSGSVNKDPHSIEAFIKNYVAFSGPNFPHVLVPLMAKHNVMINTERPLVIYDNMSFKLEHTEFSDAKLIASDTTLEINGKRGDADLHFEIASDEKVIGHGKKKLIISGMREYDHDTINAFTENYLARMADYQAS